MALQLLTGQAAEPTELEVAAANVAFVPLGTPLLAGPGAIVATMLFVQRSSTAGDKLAFGLAIVAVVILLWLAIGWTCGVHIILTHHPRKSRDARILRRIHHSQPHILLVDFS